MKKTKILGDVGENSLIKIIEKVIYDITGKELLNDDSFFFSLPLDMPEKVVLVLNSDMMVSTTDFPPQMNYYQMGRKSVIMNISDIIVKNVKPRGIIISLGLPRELSIRNFKLLIKGIVDCSKRYDLDYIGGDLNETKEIIINPTVFGYQEKKEIIYRQGMKGGDLLVANRKFGLTGVGLDILLNKNGDLTQFPLYKRSIMSVLEPEDFHGESFILASAVKISASIDSSDGLARSLNELIKSNSNRGFEIYFNENLIDEEVLRYSSEYSVSLKDLVLNAGEEFIHLFTISKDDIQRAFEVMRENNMKLYKIGNVISEEKIYLMQDDIKIEFEMEGFEHFK